MPAFLVVAGRCGHEISGRKGVEISSRKDAAASEGTTFDNLDHSANELFEYLLYYNNLRPHQALAGQTPKAFAATKTTAIQSAN